MIIDEKWMYPSPPPYYRLPPPAFSQTPAATWTKPTFSSLGPHLLLQIVYSTFPQRDGQYEGEGKIERQRLNLHWLETSLRLVNKALYAACMHILRSTYLPAYDSLIRSPYTSDPFSSLVLPTSPESEGELVHRELAALDLFIALLAHENLLLDATSLHLPREEAYKDLFDMVQPRSRLEDIVLEEGAKAGLVYTGNSPPPELEPQPDLEAVPSNTYNSGSPSPTKVSFNPFSRSSYISLAKSKIRRTSHSTPPSPSTPTWTTEDSPSSPIGTTATASGSSGLTKRRVRPLPFGALNVSFSPRRVALVYTPSVSSSNGAGPYNGSTFGALSVSVRGPTATGGMKAKKTLVEVGRARDEPLEVTAKRLIEGLEDVLISGSIA
ncbi:hypothetical protein D9757_001721 [Collybiopsis confluens]|uniref:Uncharacterized protein n=1 Tax=Collybiopsis confluens TaxID=2823264 RepID=A0A8H5HYI2_9AGAR|nr:hypothetical protein D9757_001721 [Collybiopsis confluens]